MQGKICRKLIVSGRVQGVFYRKSAKEKATELQLGGTVQNLDSGQVEILICGEVDRLNKFVKWCRTGPPLAHVEKLESSEMELIELSEFLILK